MDPLQDSDVTDTAVLATEWEKEDRATMKDEGLILPRKPRNPCLESSGHKELRRELIFNVKTGKSVIGQKSELQTAMEKHREQQVRRATEETKEESQLEKIISERARRLESATKPAPSEANCDANEFLQIHAKLRARSDTK